MTEEQLDYFSKQTATAVKKATSKTRRVALAGYLVFFVTVAAVWTAGQHNADNSRHAIVRSAKVVAVAGCNVDYRFAKNFQGLFTRLDEANKAQFDAGAITADARQRAHDFYARNQKTIPVPDCRKAENVVSSDPDGIPPVPTPLYER